MRNICRRLCRLEQRCRPAVESEQSSRLRTRLEAARQRCGLPATSPERLAELRGMGMEEILKAGRRRAALRALESLSEEQAPNPQAGEEEAFG